MRLRFSINEWQQKDMFKRMLKDKKQETVSTLPPSDSKSRIEEH